MATAKTDLEKAADEQSKLVAEIEKLRQQADDEERKLLEKQQVQSVQADTALLEQEKARLEARLASAKEAAEAYADTKTPLELAAESASLASSATSNSPDQKKEA